MNEKQIREFSRIASQVEKIAAELKDWTYWNRADMTEEDGNEVASVNNDLAQITEKLNGLANQSAQRSRKK